MSDYLWDKTGEPDAEVERLEQLLGALAHESRALELPAAARVEHATPFFRRRLTRPAFAAAAALALMLLAGAWLALSRLAPRTRPASALSGNVHNRPFMQHKPETMQRPVHNVTVAVKRASRQPPVKAARANAETAGVKRRGVGIRAERPREELAAVAERQQAAKDQLIYALRLTGAKLSEVQTKVRGSSEERHAPGVPRDRIR